MPVYVHESKAYFHLTDGATFSRVLGVNTDNFDRRGIEELYYGSPLPDSAVEYLELTERPNYGRQDMRFAPNWLYPCAGANDYRPCALKVLEPDGTCATELEYLDYELISGKPAIPGLPAVYTEADAEADTIAFRCADRKTGLQVKVYQTVLNRYGALSSYVAIENGGQQTLILEKAASGVFAQRGGWDLLHLWGAWAKERNVERVPAMHGVRSIGSNLGASGHKHNPFLALMAPEATEFEGSVLGMSLVYSGNFLMEAEENEQGRTRVVCGISELEWKLEPCSTFATPEVITVWHDHGLNAMSQVYHALYRERLCRGVWRDQRRPVLVNNWEGTYFDFNEEKLLKIAKAGADLGLELFVLDDGWFGKRNDDSNSLGDWFVNYDKLPNGLSGLSQKVHDLGIKFGLWVEPEMISPDSELYRAHPDWCIHAPGRQRSQQRFQLVLDLSRPDVCEWLAETMIRLFTEANVDYVKWDMNRNFAEAGSALLPPDRQRELPHRYMLGLYSVLERITSALPQVLFECCASGGGRYDPGMLYYMPQVWTSDDSDAVERLFIQYGTSIPYPASTMGAHVSASPNHQVGRRTGMKMRGDVAMGGNMGYELDLSAQTPEDLAEMKLQVERVKKYSRITQQGRFTRLASPFEGRIAAWQFTSPEEDEVLVFLFRRYTEANAPQQCVRVMDIDETAMYEDDSGKRIPGALLRRNGLPVEFPDAWGEEAASVMHHFVKVK